MVYGIEYIVYGIWWGICGACMAVPVNWGSFSRGLGLLSRGLGLRKGRFRVDPDKTYTAVSANWESALWASFYQGLTGLSSQLLVTRRFILIFLFGG